MQEVRLQGQKGAGKEGSPDECHAQWGRGQNGSLSMLHIPWGSDREPRSIVKSGSQTPNGVRWSEGMTRKARQTICVCKGK